jgi:poly-D-alanine transfer protein DltD
MQSPELFASDSLMAFAAQRLVEDSLLSRAEYLVSLPLGKVHNAILAAQDCWATYTYIQSQQQLDSQVAQRPSDIQWSNLMRTAEEEQWGQASNNAFGFDNAIWADKYRALVAERHGQFSDAWFLDNLQHTAEWTDLDLLLRGLSEMGAEPLILSQPMAGTYYEYIGISAAARSEYYARLRAVAATYGVPVVDFADHDGDVYFVTDPNSHLSRKGWTYYDRALDAFYHGTLGELASREWSASAVLPANSVGFAPALR